MLNCLKGCVVYCLDNINCLRFVAGIPVIIYSMCSRIQPIRSPENCCTRAIIVWSRGYFFYSSLVSQHCSRFSIDCFSIEFGIKRRENIFRSSLENFRNVDVYGQKMKCLMTTDNGSKDARSYGLRCITWSKTINWFITSSFLSTSIQSLYIVSISHLL